MSGIQVHIAKVSGLRRRRPQRVGGWFCVWGRVAIQIEGKRRGMIDVEDRLVLVKARNEKQAKARLSSEWRAYSEPYLNHRGEMVRWKLTEVQDVYELFDGEINPKGTEVYSRLDQRRMRAADAWMPARSAPMTLRALEKSSRTPPAPANRRTGHLQIRR